MKTLTLLFQQKAAVEAQIRGVRVKTIRQVYANRKENDAKMELRLGRMEAMIHSVFYDHAKLDDLLEEIEIFLGLE